MATRGRPRLVYYAADSVDAHQDFTRIHLTRTVEAARRGDVEARQYLLSDEGLGLLESVGIDPGAAVEALVRQWLGERAGLVQEVN